MEAVWGMCNVTHVAVRLFENTLARFRDNVRLESIFRSSASGAGFDSANEYRGKLTSGSRSI